MGALAPVISFSPKTLIVFWIWVTVTDASWPHSCHLLGVSIFLLSCYRICLICGKHPITVFRKKRGGNLAKFLFSLCYEDDQVKLCTKLWSDKSVMWSHRQKIMLLAQIAHIPLPLRIYYFAWSGSNQQLPLWFVLYSYLLNPNNVQNQGEAKSRLGN